MGRYVIKASRDRDLYVEWSEEVDAPTFIGNRVEMLDHLTCEHGQPFTQLERVRRADEVGTSAQRDPLSPNWAYPLTGEWSDTGLIVQQRGWLPRDRFAQFLDAYLLDPDEAYKLLDPFEKE